MRVGSQRCDQNQIWVRTGLGSGPEPGYQPALGRLGRTRGAKSGAKGQDLGARSGGRRSLAAGPIQRHPAQPGATVDGAGDVEGAVGDAEEAVIHPVGVVEVAEVGWRVLPAELCRGQRCRSDPVPVPLPATTPLPTLTGGVELRRGGEGPPGGERTEAEPFCKRLGGSPEPPWCKKWGEEAQSYAPQHPPAPSLQFWGWMAAFEASSSSRVLWPRLALAWPPAGGCSRTL